MATSSRLVSLRNADIQTLLKSIGSKSSGRKGVMIDQLQYDSKIPKLSFVSAKSTKIAATTRVLSIDMGIKNLAFCVCDVPNLTISSRKNKANDSTALGLDSPLELSVVAWKRITVTGPSTPRARTKKATAPEKAAVEVKELHQNENDDPFSPPSLSKTAYTLVREVLLPYNPDLILIERQRFRSGSGSAVQEWTVRVGMFESMIWAVLETLKNEQKAAKEKQSGSIGCLQVRDVSPKLVASFWIGDAARKVAAASKAGGAKMSIKTKVDKKQKVELVYRWFSPTKSEKVVDNLVNVSFEGDATRTRDAFLAAKTPRKRKDPAPEKVKSPRRKKGEIAIPAVELSDSPNKPAAEILQEEPLLDIGKLDDLADCLLQAAAWTKWEKNRLVLRRMIDGDDVESLEEWVQDRG
jgi:cruciform cutting endonuclease 1